jgi:hypothetical protein
MQEQDGPDRERFEMIWCARDVVKKILKFLSDPTNGWDLSEFVGWVSHPFEHAPYDAQ